MCRSRRELSNAYFLAKFGLDTAENEPFQVPFQFAGAAPAAGRKQASLVARFFPGLFTNTIGMESEQRTEFGLHGRTDLVEL